MDEYSSRLKRLEENLRELERFRGTSIDDLEGRQKRWALRYGMLESIQAIIDIACAVVSRYNLGYPDSYADCFRVLRRENVLPDDLTDRLTQAVGMQNVLVHEYLVDCQGSFFRLCSDLKIPWQVAPSEVEEPPWAPTACFREISRLRSK